MAGFFVSDSRPYFNTRPVNPRCCSDPGVLCVKCAREALTRMEDNVTNATNRLTQEEQDDILEIPTINYQELVEQRRLDQRKQELVTNAGDVLADRPDLRAMHAAMMAED